MARKHVPARVFQMATDVGPRHQHISGRLEVVQAPDPEQPKGATIRRAQVADPVKAMVHRGMAYRCYLAAEQFRRDMEMAEADARIPSQLRPSIPGGASSDDRRGVDWVAAQQRVHTAWRIVGMVAAGVVSWCVVPRPCDHGRAFGTLRDYAACKGIRRQRAADTLEAALTRLADHYDLGRSDPPRDFV